MRVALYARYSSDLQNERSAEDQFGALRAVAQARGWLEVAAFADRGISGAALANRPGVQTLLQEAERGAFDIVLTEALDRLSRDQEGTAHIFKRLGFHNVQLETLSEGKISELHVGLSGTMNQLFLAELAKKTRRGLVARVKAGHSGGGRCYGYDIVPGEERGRLTINEEQAQVVRRIYRDYAGGTSPRSIAHALNNEGVPGPRGGTWSPSAIAGDRRARDGILCQELYIGVRVFNRRKFRKHPDSGRRSAVLNKESDWLREPIPQLRILDDELWQAVQSRHQALSEQPAAYARKPKRLLSGLMKCAVCGSSMTLNGGKYACSSNRERGTCSNGKIIAAETIERRLIEGVRTKLLAPEAIDRAVREHREAEAAKRREILRSRAPIERELAEIARKVARAQEMCLAEAISIEDLKALKAQHQGRQQELEDRLASLEQPSDVAPMPGAAAAYARLAERLQAAMMEGSDGEKVRTELRALIERVDFRPLEGLGKFELKVYGKLAALLGVSERAAASSQREVLVGAGTGFEPVTFRL
ncbi:recombinase family protein [Phenylobacterium sp.]|uniref:recombinase family protein n=1 Tax=Phenylobacterium sp. TaxID=1871053 RepID=UPI0035B19872